MMTLSIMQRKRELGLLSAYGMSGMQLKRSLWMEAVMITGFAGLSSTIAGSVVGVIVGMSTIGGGGFPLLLISWLVVASIVIGWVSAFIPGIIVLRDGAHGIRDE
jgi:ABC-type antimicrobial peptide transport system permease subunit